MVPVSVANVCLIHSVKSLLECYRGRHPQRYTELVATICLFWLNVFAPLFRWTQSSTDHYVDLFLSYPCPSERTRWKVDSFSNLACHTVVYTHKYTHQTFYSCSAAFMFIFYILSAPNIIYSNSLMTLGGEMTHVSSGKEEYSWLHEEVDLSLGSWEKIKEWCF